MKGYKIGLYIFIAISIVIIILTIFFIRKYRNKPADQNLVKAVEELPSLSLNNSISFEEKIAYSWQVIKDFAYIISEKFTSNDKNMISYVRQTLKKYNMRYIHVVKSGNSNNIKTRDIEGIKKQDLDKSSISR